MQVPLRVRLLIWYGWTRSGCIVERMDAPRSSRRASKQSSMYPPPLLELVLTLSWRCRYVNYAMFRVRMLKHYGVTPLIVFDGGLLPSKMGTEDARERSVARPTLWRRY